MISLDSSALVNTDHLEWAIGSFAAAIALQIVSQMPVDKWRHAVYSMWFFVGAAIIVLLLIPETPRFHAQRGNHEKAKKIMKQIYGNVPNYDLEHEYSIILKEIDDGKVLANNQKGVTVMDCFRGTNLVSSLSSCDEANSNL